MKNKLNGMSRKDLLMLSFLADVYVERYDTEEFSYDKVDDFYAYLGYELYAEALLKELSIEGTSDLQEAMLNVNNYL